MRRFAAFALLSAGLAAPSLRAETGHYAIAVPAGTPAKYEIAISTLHPGRVVFESTWTGPRLLSFRLAPGSPGAVVLHRSGPSPQRLDFEVTADQLKSGPLTWTLEIRAPAGRDAAEGSVTVTVPDAPEVVAAREEAERPPPPPPPVPDPWTLAVSAPEEASPRVALLFTRVEDLRAAVFGDDPFTIHDPCAWQAEGLRWLSERRDRLVADAKPLTPETLRYLRRVARAIQGVEGLRTTNDPLLAGPVPDTPLRKQAWLIARRDAIRPIEAELDAVSRVLRAREVAELTDVRWLARLLACTAACERAFEAGGRRAGQSPENADATDTQWARIVAAAGVFDALAAWLDPETSP